MLTLKTICPFCGETHFVQVKETDYWRYANGTMVQDAFPYLSADEREMLISGICPECWELTIWVDEE